MASKGKENKLKTERKHGEQAQRVREREKYEK
jgi:hypothetical protein